ncbi:MAG: NADP-dependent malic enzyme [Candidatus Woesearchaeota archaeon]
MDFGAESVRLHREKGGKLEIASKFPLVTRDDLSIAYTPGVAEPCLVIAKEACEAFNLTIKKNTVAVISDGSAVLGLGNIGALASLPVMEGKAVLFKNFAGVDAFPIVIDSQDVDRVVETVKLISPTFGGINLEDFKAPECFEIERRLQDLGIPVMHDDQHGTAVVVLAGLINALKLVGKSFAGIKVVINGVGAAGTAIAKLLVASGVLPKNLFLVDSRGVIFVGRDDLINNKYKQELALMSNLGKVAGSLSDVLVGADVFIGVSVRDLLSDVMLKSMASDAIVFALANPHPEVLPSVAKENGVRIIATGRSDFPNQVNNVLAFPGIFRGALDVRAKRITEAMKVAAANAIAGMVSGIDEENILPSPLNRDVAVNVASAVGSAWLDDGD